MKNDRVALLSFLFFGLAACVNNGRLESRPPAGDQSDLYQDASELWIFERGDEDQEGAARTAPATGEDGWFVGQDGRFQHERAEIMGEEPETTDLPACGGLLTDDPHSHHQVPVPLEHTDVKGEIRGAIATVDVEQRFHNPYDEKIEAVYVFPLPEKAAVHDFLMKIGERTIRGIVRERKEAEQIYERAKSGGYVASLLTEERPNIFTQKVANIEPGASLAISIRYFDTLPLRDGWYEFVFPMVVGPRFNPPASHDGVGAVARGASGSSGQATEVSYLAPGERSGHDIALALDLDAGLPIQDWECRTHQVDVARKDGGHLQVALKPDDRIPDRDFVLRYRVASDELATSVVTGRDERGAYFALTLQPPATADRLEREPVELVFVLDTSGSMEGQPLDLCKDAMRRALEELDERDSFQIMNFSEEVASFARKPVPATHENLKRGLEFVHELQTGGGTMMIKGIQAALSLPGDPERQRIVAFLTDGFIGNEAEILAEERRLLGSTRVFAFGVGSSVNRYLIEELAHEGRGVSAYVGLHDDAAQTMEAFLERIRRPALEHIELASSDLALADVYPQTIPDLFSGRPLTIVARFDERTPSSTHWIDVRGRVGGRSLAIPVRLDRDGASATALPWIFGRARIASLSSQALVARDTERAEITSAIRETALEYGLSSAYTAFVAVDSMTRTQGDHGVSVEVPVNLPAGTRYETTVKGRE